MVILTKGGKVVQCTYIWATNLCRGACFEPQYSYSSLLAICESSSWEKSSSRDSYLFRILNRLLVGILSSARVSVPSFSSSSHPQLHFLSQQQQKKYNIEFIRNRVRNLYRNAYAVSNLLFFHLSHLSFS